MLCSSLLDTFLVLSSKYHPALSLSLSQVWHEKRKPLVILPYFRGWNSCKDKSPCVDSFFCLAPFNLALVPLYSLTALKGLWPPSCWKITLLVFTWRLSLHDLILMIPVLKSLWCKALHLFPSLHCFCCLCFFQQVPHSKRFPLGFGPLL